nr:methyltransferase domain-containing protein [Chiayiivirga flava]
MIQRTRRRIDWVASQCRGPQVLDVGCSEGIVALLLAREGLSTTGVDTNAEAIAAARTLIAQESDAVQARVRFHHGDLESAALPAASFDTLVMGEILEHLIAPERLLETAIACLRDGGRLVITTPFGYHPDDDHRQEFGLAQFSDMVRRWTAVETIEVVDGYIRYAGIRDEAPDASWAELGDRALVELGDDAARAAQHALHRHIRNHKKRISTLEKTVGKLEKDSAQATDLRLKVRDLEAALAAQVRNDKERASRIAELERAAGDIDRTLRSERGQRELLQARTDDMRTAFDASRQRNRDLGARIASLKALTLSQARQIAMAEASLAQIMERKRADTSRLTEACDKKLKAEIRKHAETRQRLAIVSASDKHYRHAVRELRKSVSFRIGQVFVQAAQRPLTGVVLLPFRLLAVVWNYIRVPHGAHASKRSEPTRNTEVAAVRLPRAAVGAPAHRQAIEAARFEAFVPHAHRAPASPVIATVLDEFSEQCFAPEARLLPLSKREWQTQLETTRPDLLLVESAWRGNGGQWKGEINRCAEKPDAALPKLVAYCREHGIPTVFWNKEDPLNYDQFIAAARLFDHVFTTDESLLPKYREDLGHDRVAALPFAAQPDIHNPTSRRDEFDVAFAGSWFAEKHDTRRAVLEPLLDAATHFELHIFDRHSALDDPRYAFPSKYRQWIRPALPYSSVLTAYRRFKVFLNANSVLESPSMFSRRVFELLACATPVVSTPSAGMEAMLPGLVRVARDEAEARAHIAELLGDEEKRRIEGHLAMRAVLTDHTYRVRLAQVMQRIGLPAPVASAMPRVSIVLCTNRPENLPNCLHNVRRQSYPDIELMLVLNRNGVDLNEVRAQFADLPNVTVLHVDEAESLYTCLNAAIAQCSGQIWSKMDDDNVYGDHYIADLVRAMEFSHADIVGKTCYYTLLEHRNLSGLRRMGVENGYVKFVQGGTITARVATTTALRWSEDLRSGGDSQYLRDAAAAGLSIYSSDRFNFVSVRRGDEGGHTWTIKDEDYLKRCEGVREGIDLSRILI